MSEKSSGGQEGSGSSKMTFPSANSSNPIFISTVKRTRPSPYHQQYAIYRGEAGDAHHLAASAPAAYPSFASQENDDFLFGAANRTANADPTLLPSSVIDTTLLSVGAGMQGARPAGNNPTLFRSSSSLLSDEDSVQVNKQDAMTESEIFGSSDLFSPMDAVDIAAVGKFFLVRALGLILLFIEDMISSSLQSQVTSPYGTSPQVQYMSGSAIRSAPPSSRSSISQPLKVQKPRPPSGDASVAYLSNNFNFSLNSPVNSTMNNGSAPLSASFPNAGPQWFNGNRPRIIPIQPDQIPEMSGGKSLPMELVQLEKRRRRRENHNIGKWCCTTQPSASNASIL